MKKFFLCLIAVALYAFAANAVPLEISTLHGVKVGSTLPALDKSVKSLPFTNYSLKMLKDVDTMSEWTFTDKSDSSFWFPGPNNRDDANDSMVTGMYVCPSNIHSDSYNFGFGQMIQPFGADFTVGEVITLMYPLDKKVTNDYLVMPVAFKNSKFGTKKFTPFNTKINIDSLLTGQYHYAGMDTLLSEPFVLSQDTINSHIDFDQGLVSSIEIIFPTPFVVPANTSWGLIFVPDNYESPVDAEQNTPMLINGGFEWGLDSTKSGALIFLDAGATSNHEVDMQNVSIYYRTIDNAAATHMTSLNKVGIRQNFDFRIFGAYDNSASVSNTGSANGFTLDATYPNPVVSSSKINFSLPTASNITLKVYNEMGIMVAVLANGFYNEGSYQADFNSDNLMNGVYYYTLSNGTNSITKSMQVIR